MDIAEFLTAQYDADEALARSVVETTSSASSVADDGDYSQWELEDGGTIYAHCHVPIARSPYSGYFEGNTGRFIAAHDPSRVLADIAVKRRLLAEIDAITIRAVDGFPDDQAHERPAGRMLRALAMAYADHADYDPAWRVED